MGGAIWGGVSSGTSEGAITKTASSILSRVKKPTAAEAKAISQYLPVMYACIFELCTQYII